jgi:hypothetical protein
MYYGGEPAAWTTAPAIPDGARFEHSAAGRKEGGGAGEKMEERGEVGEGSTWGFAFPHVFYTSRNPLRPASFPARLTAYILPNLRTSLPQAYLQPLPPEPSKNGSQPWLTRWLDLGGSVFRSLARRARPAASAKSARTLNEPSLHLLPARAGVRGRRAASPCPMKRKLLSNAEKRRASVWPSGRPRTLECEEGRLRRRARGERGRGACESGA